jgi:hypothetical protein
MDAAATLATCLGGGVAEAGGSSFSKAIKLEVFRSCAGRAGGGADMTGGGWL